MNTKQQKLAQIVGNNQKNQNKIVEKVIFDLEDICKKLLTQFQNDEQIITNDSYELQKFCSKLEFLLQFKLKEKKSLLSNNTNGNKDYWIVFVNLLNNTRTFEDAIKYVKNLNEIKTNVGRGRAFIRFCLQYHRLADAIQQITLDDKLLSNYYVENCVWFNINQKSKIIQILYDLNDINFDIITKSNYELDTSWPTVMPTHHQANSQYYRSRTLSYTSISSSNAENIESLLSSTPLEMDDEIFSKLLHKSEDKYQNENDDLQSHMSYSKKVSPTSFHSNEHETSSIVGDNATHGIIEATHHEFELYDKKLKEYEIKLHELELNLNKTKDENKELNDIKNENKYLLDQINSLNNKISEIERHNEENLKHADNLSNENKINENLEMLKNNEIQNVENKNEETLDELKCLLDEFQQKYFYLEDNYNKLVDELNINKNENDVLKREINSLRFEISAKTLNEENLVKEATNQTHSLSTLKDMCLQQEITINRLKENLDFIKNKRQAEIDIQLNEIQALKHTLELKENENLLLNDQVTKLTKSLEEERKLNKSLTNEINELKKNHENENEEKASLINQLEMDNNEIKKRLVKLIKEKADLWQKADSLEYENLLKSTAMWQDDANIHNCMSCNSQFNFLLRKHHCRICLKIYCYYCCNNWIEYNNSKVRVCKKCFENQENIFKLQTYGELAHRTESITTATHEITELPINNSHHHDSISNNTKTDIEDDDEDDDPDINFEVRSEKLPYHEDINNKNNNNNSNSNTNANTTSLDRKIQEPEYFIPDNAIDDLDTFAIVSNDEINKVLNENH